VLTDVNYHTVDKIVLYHYDSANTDNTKWNYNRIILVIEHIPSHE